MDRDQFGNIVIGVGVLTGLGLLAYWLMSNSETAAEGTDQTVAEPSRRAVLTESASSVSPSSDVVYLRQEITPDSISIRPAGGNISPELRTY